MTFLAQTNPHILVLGAGFAGLTFCKNFPCGRARITLVDRQNHHLFQPLLYQVATAGLSAPDIAQPIRAILSRRRDVTVLMDEVKEIKLNDHEVRLAATNLEYDYLILALGSVNSYFSHPNWKAFAPGLKTLEDALQIRSQILLAFERAEAEPDKKRQKQLMATVVVGGGPTGVEMAGAFAELARTVLQADFRRIDPRQARVLLIEAGPRLLSHLSEESSQKAKLQLDALGVEVRMNSPVQEIQSRRVILSDEVINAQNIIWTAGVSASQVTNSLGVELDNGGRIKTEPDLSLFKHPEVFAIGDIAHVSDDSGKLVPAVSPAAKQMASHAAKLIAAKIAGSVTIPCSVFKYRNKGSMATIGRSAAVAEIGSRKLSGWTAWAAWLGVHLIFLIGFRNKVAVLIQWIYSYFTYRRGARIINYPREESALKSNGDIASQQLSAAPCETEKDGVK